MKNKKNILVLGAYGQDNVGDEALLKSVLDNLKLEDYSNIYVNSMDPTLTSKIFGVKAFYTGFLHTIIPFLKSNIIIYGGGTILVELRMTQYIKSLPLIRSFLLNFFGTLLGKKVIYLGIGAEEVSNNLSRWLMKNCIRFCSKCFVRDQKSFDILSKYDKSKVILTSDLVFAIPKVERENFPSKKRILVLPLYRIINFETYYAKYLETLIEFANEAVDNGYQVEFFPMRVHEIDPKNDAQILKDIQRKTKSEVIFNYEKYSIDEFIRYISNFDLVISSRFHGLIFGIIENIPVISLSEFDKNTSLMKAFELENYSLVASELSSQKLMQLVRQAFFESEEIKAQEAEKIVAFNLLAKKNFEYISNL